MTQFLSKSFSVAMNLGDKGRENYDRIFGKKKKPPRVYIEAGGNHRITVSKPKKKAK